MCSFEIFLRLSHDSTMIQLSRYHARDPGFDSHSRHTRVIPGSSQLSIPIQPQTKHNQRTSMLIRHCISYIYIQLTVYHNDHITITHITDNGTEELLHANIIKVALPVSLNPNCHVSSEYNRRKHLYSREYGLIPLPFRHSRQDNKSFISVMSHSLLP